MMKVIEQLPSKQQTILRLRHMEGMEMKDIAEPIGTNEVAIRKSLSRARMAVRDEYKKSIKMKSENNIKLLIDKFFEGETTLQEEHLLCDYFASNEVEEDLKPLQQMFLDMKAIETPKMVAVKKPISRWHRIAISAAAIFAGTLLTLSVYKNSQENYCEIYVYGQKVTDKNIVMNEVQSTMRSMVDNSANVDDELQSIFAN